MLNLAVHIGKMKITNIRCTGKCRHRFTNSSTPLCMEMGGKICNPTRLHRSRILRYQWIIWLGETESHSERCGEGITSHLHDSASTDIFLCQNLFEVRS